MKYLFAVLLLAVLAVPAFAQTQDAPAFSMKRVTLAAGVDYAWFDNRDDTPLPGAPQNEFVVGLHAAYLLPTLKGKLALIGSENYGADSKHFETKLGLRLSLYRGNGQ